MEEDQGGEKITVHPFGSIHSENTADKSTTPILSRAPKIIAKNILSIIPEEVAINHRMVAFGRKGNVLKVAMVNPQNIEALNVLRFLIEKDKFEAEIYAVSSEIFQEMVGGYVSAEKAVQEVVESFREYQPEDSRAERRAATEKIQESIQDAPVSKLVQVIIRHAIDGRASDVHIEPADDNYRVRFRVDGVLHSSLVLPMEVGRAVVSRIKILSNLKIDEKRKPQDGRFKIEDGNDLVDFRVSTLPVVDGEKIALRVLARDNDLLDLDNLGLVGRNKEILEKRIRDPYGIILITGPTGSGKSTTLYAFLQILNQEERNIVTLEDPVEYYMEGINQSQIKPEIGYDFASGLRSILRQDPNVIMVGEIRDSETAELAIHAALTGHLVFSTLHTNDSIGAIPRLIDMGIEPFLLTSSLRLVAAQRLVREICDKCKTEAKISAKMKADILDELGKIPPAELKKYGLDMSENPSFQEGKGCDQCGNTGYKGRVALFETVELTDGMQEIIVEKKGNDAVLKNEAERQGMITIRQDGIIKALMGRTTLAEVERVVGGIAGVGGADD